MRHKWDDHLWHYRQAQSARVRLCLPACVSVCVLHSGDPIKWTLLLVVHVSTSMKPSALHWPSLWETLTRSVLIKGLQPPQQVESCTGPRNDWKSSMLLSYYLITTNFTTLNRLKQTHKQRDKGDLSVLCCWAGGTNGHPLIIPVIFPPQWINLCLILTPFLWCVQRIYAAMEEYKFQ